VPIFVAVMMVVRRGRTEVRRVPCAGPPLSRLFAEEIAYGLRQLRGRLSGSTTMLAPTAVAVVLVVASFHVPVSAMLLGAMAASTLALRRWTRSSTAAGRAEPTRRGT
jgi:hypothetical protein